MSLGSSGRPFSPNKPPSSPIGRAVEIYDTSQRESDQSYQVPIIGLGSFVTGDKPETMRDELLKFFQFGGRLIEISELFSNYHLLNQILQECQLSRQDIYIVYKVWPKDVSPEQLLEKIHQFINASCWEYIDILLVHAPIDVANRFEQWKALETLKKQNLVKIIGNSNLSINELMTVMKNSEILPSIHSMEVSPFFQQHDIGDYCLSSSVVVINSESLVKGTRYRHPVVKQIANNLGILPIQLLFQWSVTKGYITLVPSHARSILLANEDIFLSLIQPLPTDIMTQLDLLDDDVKTSWAPVVEEDG